MELRQDQREAVEKLMHLLRDNEVVSLQAPTGWGKSYVAMEVVRRLRPRRALWLVPLISVGSHIYSIAREFGLKAILTGGRERLCSYGYTQIEFLSGACRKCELRRVKPTLPRVSGSITYAEIREATSGSCPYEVQELVVRSYDFDLVIAHYGRANKLSRLNPPLVVVDEAHNTALPRITQIPTREVRILLEKLGFREEDTTHLTKNPELLRDILRENLTQLTEMADDEVLRPTIENTVNSLDAKVWYYSDDEDAVIAVDIPDIPKAGKALLMSATLPPSILTSTPAIVIPPQQKRHATLIDKYPLTLRDVERHSEEIKHLLTSIIQPGDIIFTTEARLGVLPDGVVTEDEVKTLSELMDIMNRCEKAIALRFFGRFSEGWHLRESKCQRKVILLGLPLLPPNVLNRLRINEKDLVTIKTVQTLGRIPEADAILIDRRYRRYKDELRNYGIETTK